MNDKEKPIACNEINLSGHVRKWLTEPDRVNASFVHAQHVSDQLLRSNKARESRCPLIAWLLCELTLFVEDHDAPVGQLADFNHAASQQFAEFCQLEVCIVFWQDISLRQIYICRYQDCHERFSLPYRLQRSQGRRS